MPLRGLDHNYQFPEISFERVGRQSPSVDAFSRYRRQEIVSYNGLPTLETYYPLPFPDQPDDLSREAAAQHNNRPDLLGLDNYAVTDKLWWVIMLANGVLDPFRETEPGIDFRIPAFQRVAERLVSL